MPRKKKQVEDEKKISEKKKLSDSEFEKQVIELAKKGLSSEKIGEALRKEGIHPKEHNKKISIILKKNKLYINPDLKNIEIKLERVKKHYEKNKQDKRSMSDKDRIFAHLKKQKEYFG